ncbi:hypothetical protein S101446_00327 [Komagataeibacter europaeus]|nr:hypothetical protein S101446_00327 [Komagataeibacter europaeus]
MNRRNRFAECPQILATRAFPMCLARLSVACNMTLTAR